MGPDATGQQKVLVQVRLPKDLVKELDHMAVDLDLYRAETVERLLRDGLQVRRQQLSLLETR